VLLADDHPLMIAAVRSALESEKDFEIVGEATSGSQVMPLVSSARPDVVLIDLRLPEVDGLTCLERIREKHPSVKVVFFSAVDERSEIAAVLAHGACAATPAIAGCPKLIPFGGLATIAAAAVPRGKRTTVRVPGPEGRCCAGCRSGSPDAARRSERRRAAERARGLESLATTSVTAAAPSTIRLPAKNARPRAHTSPPPGHFHRNSLNLNP
jgi:chemotaxis response regulator CheB